MRSPAGHFSFNSTGPLGGLSSEGLFNLPDLVAARAGEAQGDGETEQQQVFFMDDFV